MTFSPTININSFYLNPSDELELKNIILSLNPSKAINPISIPIKILKLLINDLSSQLTELFNLSFPRELISKTKPYLLIKKSQN